MYWTIFIFRHLFLNWIVHLEQVSGFHLDLDDYLLGVLTLANELVGEILSYSHITVLLSFFLSFSLSLSSLDWQSIVLF